MLVLEEIASEETPVHGAGHSQGKIVDKSQSPGLMCERMQMLVLL